ncbi:MAG: hypothetical protein ABIG96_01465 [Candidatus Micrarchaeota archaeon]
MRKEETATEWGTKRLVKAHEWAIRENSKLIFHLRQNQEILKEGKYTLRGSEFAKEWERMKTDGKKGLLTPISVLIAMLHPNVITANLGLMAGWIGLYYSRNAVLKAYGLNQQPAHYYAEFRLNRLMRKDAPEVRQRKIGSAIKNLELLNGAHEKKIAELEVGKASIPEGNWRARLKKLLKTAPS